MTEPVRPSTAEPAQPSPTPAGQPDQRTLRPYEPAAGPGQWRASDGGGAARGLGTPGAWPAGGYVAQHPAAPTQVPPPPREALVAPKRVEPVPGTPFGVVHLDVAPVTSGLAVGSLVAGITSILVALLVACFGAIGAGGGWGAWAAGAFTMLGVLAGAGAVVAGLLAMAQVRRPAPPPAVRFTGRGLAVGGVSCGAAGVLLTLGGLALALLLQFG